MSFKMKFPIIQRFLTGPSKRRPKLPMNRVGFMVAHDTGNPGSTADMNVRYYERSRNEISASAHLFVDDKEIIECIPFFTQPKLEKAYHVLYDSPLDNTRFGDDANDIAGGVEGCYGGNIDIQESYKRYVWVFAYACYLHKLNPLTDIVGHYSLDPARRSDPKYYLQRAGKTFDQFLYDVKLELEDCTKEAEEPMLSRDDARTMINTWLKPGWARAEENRLEALAAGNTEVAGLYIDQQQEIRRQANALRLACGAKEDEEL